MWGQETFWSVTTVLGALSKPAIPAWAARTVAEYVADNYALLGQILEDDPKAAIDLMKGSPWRARDTAATLGTTVHEAVENYVMGQQHLPDTVTDRHILQLEAFLEAFKPQIIEAECTVFNRTYNYAGTLDLLLELNDETWIIDVKTGKGVYPEYAMQVAGYANAEFIGRSDGVESRLPTITRAGILHLRPMSYKLIPCELSERVFKSFLYCRELFRFQEEIAPDVLQGEVRR